MYHFEKAASVSETHGIVRRIQQTGGRAGTVIRFSHRDFRNREAGQHWTITWLSNG